MRRITFVLFLLLLSLAGKPQKYFLFISTYTNGDSKGIYVYDFDAGTGETTPISTIMTENPSYLAIAPGGKFLYAVNETDGSKPGGVSAFSFDKTTGKLTFINRQASGGDDPCYVSVDNKGKWLVTANYNGGNLSALPLAKDGSIGELTQLIQHTGKGANPQRQEKPHVHSATFSPDGRYVIVADLGLDQLSLYRFKGEEATMPLKPLADSLVRVQPGSGPRHIAFYPGKSYIYLMNELGGTVDGFRWNKEKMNNFQQISSHPQDYKGAIGSADIHVTPNGKFLYASNRGDANSIAIYSIDRADGTLHLKGFQSTQGEGPRNFMIDPSGQWLLVANQRTNNIVKFRIDAETGALTPAGQPLLIPSPVCLKVLKH